MRGLTFSIGGLFVLLGSLGSAQTAAGAPGPAVGTVAGVGGVGRLSAPGGLALGGTGDVFIADTDACRVVLVASQAGSVLGLAVRAHHQYVVAGRRCGGAGSLGYPSDVALGAQGDLFIAVPTADRVVEVRPGRHGPSAPVTVAGTGTAGFSGNGLIAGRSALNEPNGVAVDGAGDLFIADSANCLVRMVPAATGVFFGQAMTAGHLYDIAGTGVCGSSGRGGPALHAQVWDPVALAVDRSGNVFIADNGDQSVLELAAKSGDYYGTDVGGGDLATVVGMGQYGPYLEDGLPATSIAAELNDPEGVAVGPSGTLYVTDGDMHCIRVVPLSTTAIFGRTMTGGDLYTLAGAVPTNPPGGAGDGTRWVITHLGVAVGIAVASSGAVYFSDRTGNVVRVIG